MFKTIHGIAPTYLYDRIVMNFDVTGYDTRGSDMELYLPTLRKDMYHTSFMYMGGKLWNDLPEFVQHSTSIESFKQNYKMYKLIISSWLFAFCGNWSISVLCNYYSFPLLVVPPQHGCEVISLTHWGRDDMDAITQTTFLSAFFWMKMFEFRLKFHWSLFLRVQLTI